MRRVARRDDIPEASRAFVERLVEARLLVADRRIGVQVVEVAHESLLRRWSALATWLDADMADLMLVEGVERAASEWQRNECLEAWLDHRGERLAAADALMARDDFRRRLGDAGLAYLAACRARDEAERWERAESAARIEREHLERLRVESEAERQRLAQEAQRLEILAAVQRTSRRRQTALLYSVLVILAALVLSFWPLLYGL